MIWHSKPLVILSLALFVILIAEYITEEETLFYNEYREILE